MFAIVADRLRNGVETQPAFDRRAAPLYVLTALQCTAAAVLIARGGFTISPTSLDFFGSAAILVAGALLLRRIGHASLGGAVESLTLLYTQGLAALFLLVPVTAFGWPFLDAQLAQADALLGFHWPAFAKSSAAFAPVLIPVYDGFTFQPAVIVPALFICGLTDRAWQFVLAFSLALVVCCVIYALVPSEGVATHFGVRPSDIPRLGAGPWHFTTVIHEIRSGPTQIDARFACGLISFPSFHTAGAIVSTWAAWPIHRLRWPVLGFNALLIIATVPIGGHYLIDVVGGLAVAWLALIAAWRIQDKA